MAGARQSAVVRTGIILALIVGTLAAFPRKSGLDAGVQAGDTWREETLVAPYDIALLKDSERLARERERVYQEVPPYFREVPAASDLVAASRDSLEQQIERIADQYAAYRSALRQGSASAAADSARYMALRRSARLKLTPAQWYTLLNVYASTADSLNPASATEPDGGPTHRDLLKAAWEVSAGLLQRPVLDIAGDSVASEGIVVRNEADRTDRRIASTATLGLDRAHQLAQERLISIFPGNPEAAELAYAYFRAIFQPSLVFLRGESLREWQRQERRISPTSGIVRRGEVIVRQGERVTPEVLRKIVSFSRARSERSGTPMPYRTLLGQFLLSGASYGLFFLYLALLRQHIFRDNRRMLLIALLFAGIVALFAVAIRVPGLPVLSVPVAVAAILLTVIFDSRVGLFGTLTLALIGGHLLHYNFEFAFATVVAGALGVFSVRDVKNRGQFFVSAGLVLIGYVLVLSAAWLLEGASRERMYNETLHVAVNAFLLLLAYPLLWLFERAFDITTDLTLLELSDTNRNVLKQLSLVAPGTFNHSLQVANLAEAAADAVGANALLARVGALYHDIGKMTRPEFFVENQRPGDNPHDHVKPRMSALIIANHVKEGIERGRQENLPERVLKFIPMHHGTTRIEYFFRKAQDQRGPDDPAIDESEFRYPGPEPDSRETGIMMLADSVEAASRSLAEPTQKRLEAVIDMIFKARMEDGQLDNTPLTFRDLRIIRETFLALLLGIYHIRVKYPGQEGAEKSAEIQTPSPNGAPATSVKRPVPVDDAAAAAGPVQERSTHPQKGPAPPLTEDRHVAPAESKPPDLDKVSSHLAETPDDTLPLNADGSFQENATATEEELEFDPTLRAAPVTPVDAGEPEEESDSSEPHQGR